MNNTHSDPLVTFILTTLNRADQLERTLQALLEEKHRYYHNLEILLIDGGSTDRTHDVLRKFQPIITRIISEPDKGVFDAMNKGITIAKGKFVRFISDDDEILPDQTASFVNYLEKNPDVDIISGRGILEFNGSNSKQCRRFNYPSFLGDLTEIELVRRGGGYIFECFYFRSNVFRDCGSFDTRWIVGSDFEYLLRAMRRGKIIHAINHVMLYRAINKNEMTSKHYTRMIIEKASITWKYSHCILALRLLFGGLCIELLDRCTTEKTSSSIKAFLFQLINGRSDMNLESVR